MTTNPRENYKNNCNTKKVAPSYNQKMRDQEESDQNYHIFQLKLKNACTRNNSQRSQQQTNVSNFMTLIISI
jgi:hypothetical protein